MAYDYKQLCNELLSYSYQCDWPDGKRFYALVERTRAALAEPEQEEPTDEELEEEFGRALLKLPGDSMNATAVSFARAVLARWGK